jgi:hypothetical protein
LFFAEIRLKTGERTQLNFRHRFWSNIVQVGRNFSKPAEFHPNWRRKKQPWVEFQPTWTISTKIGGGNSTARVRPFLNEFRQKKITVGVFFVEIFFWLVLRSWTLISDSGSVSRDRIPDYTLCSRDLSR